MQKLKGFIHKVSHRSAARAKVCKKGERREWMEMGSRAWMRRVTSF